MKSDFFYTRANLIKAEQNGEVSAIAAKGCIIRFVPRKDLAKIGVMVDTSGAIKRFNSDVAAWNQVDYVNRMAGNA